MWPLLAVHRLPGLRRAEQFRDLAMEAQAEGDGAGDEQE